jgi:hypothetical protein
MITDIQTWDEAIAFFQANGHPAREIEWGPENSPKGIVAFAGKVKVPGSYPLSICRYNTVIYQDAERWVILPEAFRAHAKYREEEFTYCDSLSSAVNQALAILKAKVADGAET